MRGLNYGYVSSVSGYTGTKGEIYIGVVGPVRTGKSTFVRRFMEQLVLPHMKKENSQVSKDELPVSGGGKTITTVEPKFVPAKAAEVELDEGITAKIRLIDCVGFVIDGAFGLDENNQVRMVKTPWLKEAIPFPQAAEIGTGKVIRDHSTVGILVTTDGTIGDFPREAYKSRQAVCDRFKFSETVFAGDESTGRRIVKNV